MDTTVTAHPAPAVFVRAVADEVLSGPHGAAKGSPRVIESFLIEHRAVEEVGIFAEALRHAGWPVGSLRRTLGLRSWRPVNCRPWFLIPDVEDVLERSAPSSAKDVGDIDAVVCAVAGLAGRYEDTSDRRHPGWSALRAVGVRTPKAPTPADRLIAVHFEAAAAGWVRRVPVGRSIPALPRGFAKRLVRAVH